MTPQPPRIIYQTKTSRKPYRRQFVLSTVLFIVALGAYWALNRYAIASATASASAPIADLDARWLDIGQVVALVLAGLLFIRMGWSLRRYVTAKEEAVRIFDQGFLWIRNGKEYKSGWGQIKTYQRGVGVVKLLGLPLIATGAQTLSLQDGEIFRFTPRLGDPNKFDRAVSPIITDITGTRIGQRLRERKGVRVSKDLAVTPQGIIAGNHKISWRKVDVTLKGDTLIVRQLNDKGAFKRVKAYNARQLVNVDGLMDVVEAVIQNHQPQRFNIRTKI